MCRVQRSLPLGQFALDSVLLHSSIPRTALLEVVYDRSTKLVLPWDDMFVNNITAVPNRKLLRTTGVSRT